MGVYWPTCRQGRRVVDVTVTTQERSTVYHCERRLTYAVRPQSWAKKADQRCYRDACPRTELQRSPGLTITLPPPP